MSADKLFLDVAEFATLLRELHTQRKGQTTTLSDIERRQRASLTKSQRSDVLSKTGERCHICGGTINANDWQADHVLAHSSGGKHSVDNYLAAHSICNNYRWHYHAEEFQWIFKLGVWLRTQIERKTAIGQNAGREFCAHERRRAGRRKVKAGGRL